MNHQNYPSSKTLVTVWIALLVLGFCTIVFGRTGLFVSSNINVIAMAVLMAVTWLKAILILKYYLDLKSASAGWNTVFVTIVSGILIIVYSMFILQNGS